MLRPRIIPCLLIKDKGLVKTVKFDNPKYVGDPLNAVKIFNEKETDEISIFDIDASVLSIDPNYSLIEKIANQSRMPICYGGGIKKVEQAQKIFKLGVEKIAISSAAVNNPELISQISSKVGSQSVVVVIDVKKKLFGDYEVFIHNGKDKTGIKAVDFAKKAQKFGAGEIIINSIDNDGIMKGYDFKLIDKIRDQITIPLTVLGGAGSLDDIKQVINKYNIIGVAAGSLFVFKGTYKAVLINYPNREIKNQIYYEN